MKKIFLMIIVSLLCFHKQLGAQAVVMDINTFHTALDPYGHWVDNPQYGSVWISNDPGFRPYYSDGYWVYTDEGWTWASDYSWGWAPFHYGRWLYADGYGWEWVPGYDWAPAWVAWSGDPDYYGWAPLSPGLSIDVAFGAIPAERWCFVPHAYIYDRSWRSHMA